MSRGDNCDSDESRANIRAGAGISRRGVMRQLGAVSAVGALGSIAGCSALQRDGGGEGTETGGGSSGGDGGASGDAPEYQLVELNPPPTELDFSSEPPERSITMVTHDASTSFFDPTIAGLHDAASQLGWSANFTGPSSGFSVEEQVSILESTVDSGPDVIATTIPDPSAFDNVINRALENDIPVITYNTLALSRDEMREKYGRALAYTGQDQVAAGYVCGLAMLERLPDDASLVTPGLSDPGHSALSARADGMEMAIRQNSDIELTDRLNYTGDSNEGISRIENHLTSNPDLDGIMGADAFTWFIGNALENQDMTGDVVGGGFDLTTDTLEHIQNGALNYTVGQDPYSQGYMPTMQMFTYMDRGIPPKDYPTGAEVIDESNIDFAMERSGGWGELRNYHNA
ncbi:sugar ABC transporter substrate-binding protein [Halomicrobium salinisoli]|uniref:sugar ABC transporter substrate-binding protein n=1 Tax=Halomicrobium salinisoli TaxID=2878391 RepID=UPI001CEFE950|nr:sugar ABC transporter substrate-binding protein [Halomicrobium salinisoli]